VQVAVGFRREAGLNVIEASGAQVLFDSVIDEVAAGG